MSSDPSLAPVPPVPRPPNADVGMPRWLWILLGGLVVCGGIVPCTGIVAAIAIPNFIAMQLKAKRAELPGNVEGIKIAVIAYRAAHDSVMPCGTRDDAEGTIRYGGKEPRAWQGGACWTELAWTPDGQVRGAYWVEVVQRAPEAPPTFEVHGVSDLDSDGVLAEYIADDDGGVRLVTPSDVY